MLMMKHVLLEILILFGLAQMPLGRPIDEDELCQGLVIFNIPNKSAFVSGGTLFEIIFIAGEVPEQCQKSTIDFHFYAFDGDDLGTPLLEQTNHCSPDPLGTNNNKVNCPSPNLLELFSDNSTNVTVEELFSNDDDDNGQPMPMEIAMEPFKQLGGCLQKITNSKPIKFCFSIDIKPGDAKAKFIPVRQSFLQEFVLNHNSLRLFPDPVFSKAIFETDQNQMTITVSLFFLNFHLIEFTFHFF